MAASDFLKYVTKATVETTYLPPITLDHPFDQGGTAAPNPFLANLRPRITLELADGRLDPVVIAPYGDPGPSRWPLVKGVLLVTGAVALGIGLPVLIGKFFK